MFKRAEFERRVALTRRAMDEAGVDLLIVDHSEMLAWLTGFTISEAMYRAAFLPREGAPWYALRDLDADICRRGCWFDDITGFADSDDPHTVMAQLMEQRGFKASRVGADFNSYGFTAATRERFAALLPQAAFVDLRGVSDSLRMAKSRAEIEILQRASGIADIAMEVVRAKIGAGDSARDAAAIAAAAFLKSGADNGDTGPIVRGNGDHEFLHAAMNSDALGDGDILHVELVPKVRNYSARLMRPILIGSDKNGLEETSARIIALQDRQIAAMRPGVVAREVDAILREGMLREGLRARFDNVSGYALGLYGRTSRASDFSFCFRPNSEWRLEENMVFHMYASARGLGFSETVLVTGEGGLRLTQTPRQLLRAQTG
ncbi:Xaa-Pro peptidase family protein [Terrarubrum flagellatum]|uniref:M24 family metallopeptidase n=1 Tax=Terrirubrum flagellatum TaxID=2895980 RepID=UPI00314544C4